MLNTKFNKNFAEIVVFFVFLVIHIFLLNINAAEWGDSYRILRGSEYIRNLSYPDDEKRPPLFSILLSLRPTEVDQVFWGRLVMFAISLASFYVFYKLVKYLFNGNKRISLITLILFSLNPVLLYWSLRIYADVPLTLIVLITIYLLTIWKNTLTNFHSIILGVIAGLSVLTRFEGYLLIASLSMGILFLSGVSIKGLKTNLKKFLSFLLGFSIIVIPYVLYRNPLSSSYLQENSGREFGPQMLAIYILSLIFVLGVVPALFFVIRAKKILYDFLFNNPAIAIYVILNLILVLLWPAAVPRLFTSSIPFLIILLAIGINQYFSTTNKISKLDIVIGLGLLALFVIGQKKLGLQFLVPHTAVLLLVAVLNLPLYYFLFRKSYKFFMINMSIILLIWSIFTVFLHKSVYKSLKDAAEYSQNNLSGKILYNDVSAVTGWYLNEKNDKDNVIGEYRNFDNKDYLTEEFLLENNVKYLLISNEHNTGLNIDLGKRPYLELIKEFSYEHGGQVFFTKVVKVNHTSGIIISVRANISRG